MMNYKTDSYFNLAIAFAIKTVLAYVNDDAWRATKCNEHFAVFVRNENKNCPVYGLSKIALFGLVRRLVEPQVGKSEVRQYVDAIVSMEACGDIEKTVEPSGREIFYLSKSDLSCLVPRTF
jgi:hypothetical protein